jgi:hypothetical protein
MDYLLGNHATKRSEAVQVHSVINDTRAIKAVQGHHSVISDTRAIKGLSQITSL